MVCFEHKQVKKKVVSEFKMSIEPDTQERDNYEE